MRALLLFFCSNVLATGLVEAREIRVAHQREFEPYAWVDSSGSAQGVFVDWWRIFSVKTGTEIEFIAGTTEQCVQMVLEGEADVVAGLFYESEHADSLSYPGFIMRLNTVLVLKNGFRPKSIYEIKDPVGILSKEISYRFVKEKYPELQLEKYLDFNELVAKVESRKVKGFIYEFPNPIIRNVAVEMPPGYYQFLVLREEKVRPAVKKGNLDILELIAEGNALIEDRDLAAIAEKYDFFEEEPVMRWWEWAGAGFTLILSVITLWLWRRLKGRRIQRLEVTDEGLGALIQKGESDQLEFKSSLRWDYRQEQSSKDLEMVIIKTIAAFLNSQGGMLLIGVDDGGRVLGLEQDYKAIGNKGKDALILNITNLVNKHLGKKTHGFLRIDIVGTSGGDVCAISIEPSDKPVFIGKNENEEFFIRASASSQPLAMSETLDYIKSRWG